MNAAPPQLRIRPIEMAELPDEVEVPDEGLTLGRDSANRLEVDGDRYPYTSSFHARFVLEGERLFIEDLDSKNGTFLNGQSITREPVGPGDIIQLGGDVGARFLVVSEGLGTDTLIATKRPAPAKDDTIGRTTIIRLKRALGLPPDAKLGPQSRPSRTAVSAIILITLCGVLGIYGFYRLTRKQDDLARQQSNLQDEQVVTNKVQDDRLEEIRASQEKSFSELRKISGALEEKVAAADARLMLQREERETQKAELESQHLKLTAKMQGLEKSGQSSAGEISRLQKSLDTTRERLEKYNPINLEKEEASRRKALERVLSAVVFVDRKIAFREKGGSRYLHGYEGSADRLRELTNKEDLYYDAPTTGSGFVVSRDGWIITNAHVVEQPEIEAEIKFEETVLEMVPIVDVIFNATSKRYEAKIVSISSAGDDDFAALKIEPFDGMPFIEEFRSEVEIPPAGSEVRLFGFPLGRVLLQDADTLKASVFRGMISRQVDVYIQVQSAVYPGNSGGPVVDLDGRVLGIVTGVQTTPDGQLASDIGFVIPITAIKKIWPPPGFKPDKK